MNDAQSWGTPPENFDGESRPAADPRGPRGPRSDRRRRGDFPPVPDDAAWFRGGHPFGGGRGGAPRGGGRGFAGPPAEGPRFDDPRPRGFGPGFGPGGPRGRGPGGRGRGPGRAGRGDVRAAILLLLAQEPMHGYQVIQEIAERSDGVWRPSPGAVYPALNLLQDEGLVEISAEGGRRLATLTEAGTAHVAERADELGDPFAEAAGRGGDQRHELRGAVQAVAEAVRQVARSGSDEQAKAAAELLERTRRELYLILAGPAVSDAASDAPVDSPVDVPADGPAA